MMDLLVWMTENGYRVNWKEHAAVLANLRLQKLSRANIEMSWKIRQNAWALHQAVQKRGAAQSFPATRPDDTP
jgi:hypothetical protein